MKIHILIILIICLSCRNKTETSEAISDEINVSSLSSKEHMNIASEGNKSPNGKLKDLNESIIDVKSFEGKLLVIDFWATWCAPCLEEAPMFREIARKYESSNVEFISISIDQEFAHWKNYISKNNWNGKNYWFGMQEDEPFFSFLYSITLVDTKEMILIGLPKYVIISLSGRVLSNSDLRPSKPGFEKEIQKHLH